MVPSSAIFHACRDFLIASFEKNPSYSFGDASLMIDHSLNVQEIALNLNHVVQGDEFVVFIGSIFHDIGKTKIVNGKPVAWEILREKHESFNSEVIDALLHKNNFPIDVINKVQQVLSTGTETIEGKLIKDADIIEFYMNRRLQIALNTWASEQNVQGELQRKADKFNSVLHFDISKELARPYWEIMKDFWYLS